MSFYVGILILALSLTVASTGGRIMHGPLRLLVVCQGFLISVGGYAYAIIGKACGSPFVALFVAMLLAGCFGVLLLSLSSRSVRDDYALLTFALQVGWSAFLMDTRPLFGGSLGIHAIPAFPGAGLLGDLGAPLVFLVIGILIQIIFWRVYKRSVFSRATAVLGRSRELASTLHLPLRKLRIYTGLFAGFSMGLAGAAYASFLTFIEPNTFSINMSVSVLAITFLAYSRPVVGMLLALLLLVAMPEAFRLLPFAGTNAGAIQMFFSGTVVCLYCFFVMGPQSQRGGGDVIRD